MPMAVTVRSIVRNARGPVQFHIVAPDFTAEQRAALAACLDTGRGDQLDFVSLPPNFHRFARITPGLESLYYRLVLAEALPHLDRLVYLDSDILVRCDVAELWERVLKTNAAVQACLDSIPVVTLDNFPVYARYGRKLNDPYYNSGVLGMNLARWRAERWSDRLADFLEAEAGRCPFFDQGAINALMVEHLEPLPREYNVFPLHADRGAKIVHYCSVRKPYARPGSLWSYEPWSVARWQSQRDEIFHLAEYFRFLDETPYRGWRPRSVHGVVLECIPVQLIERVRQAIWRRGQRRRT